MSSLDAGEGYSTGDVDGSDHMTAERNGGLSSLPPYGPLSGSVRRESGLAPAGRCGLMIRQTRIGAETETSAANRADSGPFGGALLADAAGSGVTPGARGASFRDAHLSARHQDRDVPDGDPQR
jgi:hypothetical protein